MKKMNLRLKAIDLVLKTLVCTTATLILSAAHAATDDSGKGGDIVEDYRKPVSDIVELHYPIEPDKPYKQRRNTNGFMLSIGYENVLFNQYLSAIDFTTPYSDMFGSSEIQVYKVEANYKFNFSLGSLMAGMGLGYGTLSSVGSGTMHSIEISKYSASLSYVMDALANEPYVAPYVTAGLMQLDLKETSETDSQSGSIQMAMFYQAGLLVQLNWLDDAVSRKALMDYGLQNTYADLFISHYEPSSSPDDPNTGTGWNLGAGLRLEF